VKFKTYIAESKLINQANTIPWNALKCFGRQENRSLAFRNSNHRIIRCIGRYFCSSINGKNSFLPCPKIKLLQRACIGACIVCFRHIRISINFALPSLKKKIYIGHNLVQKYIITSATGIEPKTFCV
jgi:hypothetical protein